jgi:hypothetical protein
MATTAPASASAVGRRSGRKTNPPNFYGLTPDPAPSTNPRPPRVAAPDLQSDFLAKLYFEINETVIYNADPTTDPAIRSFMRQARLARCMQELSVPQNTNLRAQVLSYVPTTTAQTLVFTRLRQDLDPTLAVKLRRLGKLSKDIWAAAICACACSQTFRAAISRPNSNDGSTLNWAVVRGLVMDNFVSIELFFLTRVRSDWTAFLSADNVHFTTALIQTGPLWQILTAAQIVTANYKGDTFGIIEGEVVPWNALGTATPLHPHEWYLPGALESGERCKITYTVTADLTQFHNTVPSRIVGQIETVLQRNNDLAMFRADYPWTRRNQWISRNDPRYAGFLTPGCPAHPTLKVQAVCPVMTGGQQQTTPRSCTCTFNTLQLRVGHPTNPLLEIAVYPRLGRCIRALQKIEKDQYLGVYVGEMYPTKRRSGTTHSYRYGGADGQCYVMEHEMQLRHRRAPKPNEDEGSPMPLRAEEFTHCIIDPAVSGNWTRYISHSCDANASYAKVNIGQKLLIIVKAEKPIRFGETITASYGFNYFSDKTFACACGMAKCKLWKREWNTRDMKRKSGKNYVDVNGNIITPPDMLARAIKKKSKDLPAWVWEEENAGIEARVRPWAATPNKKLPTGKRKGDMLEESPTKGKKVRSR